MNKFIHTMGFTLALASLAFSTPVNGQSTGDEIVLSGARFTNELFEHWIEEYQKEHPEIKFQISNKGSEEYSTADIIVHGYEVDKAEIDKNREYIHIGKYAIVPVANAKSRFADVYGEKGLNRDEITQVFFYNPIEHDGEKPLKAPFIVYTRVQLAPSPTVFAANFGYKQSDFNGRSIAGADIHLIKSVLRDPQGITYAPLSLIFSSETGRPLEGLKVIPVDFDDNGRVSDEERFYEELSTVLKNLEGTKSKNLPVANLQVSFLKNGVKPEVIRFLQWILDEGQSSLKQYGYWNPEVKSLEKDRSLVDQLAVNQP